MVTARCPLCGEWIGISNYTFRNTLVYHTDCLWPQSIDTTKTATEVMMQSKVWKEHVERIRKEIHGSFSILALHTYNTYNKQELNKMNYKLASELYKALDEGKVIQYAVGTSIKWTDWIATGSPFRWDGNLRWRIKPEPREFTILVFNSGAIGDPNHIPPSQCRAGTQVIKVREVLED